MTLPNPARLVVDIDGAQNTSPQKDYPADTAVLKDVRIGQFRAKDPSSGSRGGRFERESGL